MIEMNVEIIGQRQLRLLCIHGHAIGRSDVAERDLTGDDEIPEQMRIGRRARQHVDKKTIQRFGFLRRRQQIDVVAGGDRIGLGGREDVLIADHQRRLRPRWNKPAPEIQAFRTNRIADQLLFELTRQIKLDAPWTAIRARQRHMQPPCRSGQRPALQQQGDDDDDEGDVEIEIGLRQSDQHRDRRQKGR